MTKCWSLTVLVLLSLAACDGSSPTAPEPSRPPPATVVFDDQGALAAHQDAIVSLLLGAVERASTRLPVGVLRFSVSTQRARLIPGWGVGGYTVGPNDIDIAVDPEYAVLDGLLAERLPPMAAHEIHHSVRWGLRGFSWGTLLEALVTEGLADHFAIELTGSPVPPWCTIFPEAELSTYLARARPELDDPGYDYEAWFRRDGTGYTLGYYIVARYLASHPGSSAASLVGADAEPFRPD